MTNPSYILEAMLPEAAEYLPIRIDRKRYDLLCTDFINRISIAGIEYEITDRKLAVNYSTITPAMIIRVELKYHETKQPNVPALYGQRYDHFRKVQRQADGGDSGKIPDLAA